MPFIGRDAEKSRLSAFFENQHENAALIYGRRRVGKSELIKEALRQSGLRTLYFECRQSPEVINAAGLSSLVSEELGLPMLPFKRLDEVLDFLFRSVGSEPAVLVLDEWPYLREAVDGADSILQAMLDKYRGSSSLKVVLCGSFVSAMAGLLDQNNPLYGRFGLVLKLQPMDYLESSFFYPDFSNEDKVRFYAVFGGIPYYNRLIDPRRSFRENLMELIVTPGARLENEVSEFLRSQIAKITNANAVLEAMACGHSRFSDILGQSGLTSSPVLSQALEKLTAMGIVFRQAPINEEGNRKKTGYFISDPLSLFYYRYIYRNLSARAFLNPARFFERHIAEDLETEFVPKRFETVCAEYLIGKNRADELSPAFDKIGRYRYDLPALKRNGEFDIVTADPSGYVFYEAKFRKSPVTASVIEKEIAEVRATGLAAYRFGFFSRSGYDESARRLTKTEPLVLYDLKDLYGKVTGEGELRAKGA